MASPVHTDNYLWFGDFMSVVLRAVERGATVTRHCNTTSRGPAIELEVRLVSVDGKKLPRVPEVSPSAKPKSPKKGA